MSRDYEDLHKEAMSLSAQSFLARMQGEENRANQLTREAFKKEKLVAFSVVDEYELEPTRSVLFRSAASLALECEEYREAERLISFGLSGDPPGEIAEEMRELLDKIYFKRHLELRGVKLTTSEFQLSISGSSVGNGFAPLQEVSARVQSVETLVRRTEQRKKGISFSNSKKKGLKTSEISPYISVPRAASYAVTFRLSAQINIDGIGLPEQIVDDIITGVNLINNSSYEELKTVIADQNYYENFVGLVRSIAPDGDQVNMVGFTTVRNGVEESAALSKTKSSIGIPYETEDGEGDESNVGDPLTIKGFMNYADSNRKRKGLIKILTEEGNSEKIYVPLSLMSDVVRPLYETDVVVNGVLLKDGIHMTTIEPA